MQSVGEIGARVQRRVLDALWLWGPEQRVRAYVPAQADQVRACHRAATERLRAARDLRDARAVPAAAAICREAGRLAAATLLVSRQAGIDVSDMEPAVTWEHLEVLLAADGELAKRASKISPLLEEARRIVTGRDPLEFDRLTQPVALARLDALDRVASFLLSEVEPRTLTHLRVMRVSRVAILVLYILGVLAFVVSVALRPVNIARGKPVSASAYWPGSAPADALVNGDYETPWGSATGRGKNGWFTVDLLLPYKVRSVEVVNRSDHFAHDTPPLLVELSDDGLKFQEVTRFTEPGSPGSRWVWKGYGRVTRYVRIRRPDRNFAISEIEVFGRPQ